MEIENKKFEETIKSAEKILDNKKSVLSVLRKSFSKAQKVKDSLKDFKENLITSISLVKDWINGSYRVVPKRTIIYIVAALIYFIMPIDLIPDFLFKVGLIDDYAVLSYVFSAFIVDIEKYRKYKEEKIMQEEALIQEELNASKENDEEKTI